MWLDNHVASASSHVHPCPWFRWSTVSKVCVLPRKIRWKPPSVDETIKWLGSKIWDGLCKKKSPLKRGLNNDQPENMGTWFPANPSENRNVISHFSKNCIFIGVPSSWIMIIPSIVGSIIPKLIIGQQQFIYPLWLLALPDEFGSKDGGVADILGCHWMLSVPISLGNFNSEKW